MGGYVKLPPAPLGDSWELVGDSNPPSREVKDHTVHAALLAYLAQHPNGASLSQCQAAVDAVVKQQNLKKNAHDALKLMRWASVNRGVGFRCRNGLITRIGAGTR